MISDFIWIGWAAVISVLIRLALFLVSVYLGSIQYLGPVVDKLLAFECGFISFKDSRSKFSVSYYLLGILFLIFDLEIVHILPWAMSVWQERVNQFVWVFCFVLILTVGFVYEWVVGALSLAFIGR
jgi:NADH-quinone oxidoreductase subunit A